MRLLPCLLLVLSAFAQTADPAFDALQKAYDALKDRRYDDAIAAFRKAADIAPKRAAIRKDLAYTLLKTGESEAARDQFREAMQLEPADHHVALEYAFLCYETKQRAEARRIFDRIRKSGDPDTGLYSVSAELCYGLDVGAAVALLRLV